VSYNGSKSYPEGENAEDADEEVQIGTLDVTDEYEMTLPSGAKIGHR